MHLSAVAYPLGASGMGKPLTIATIRRPRSGNIRHNACAPVGEAGTHDAEGEPGTNRGHLIACL